jgi:hypothetical protein
MQRVIIDFGPLAMIQMSAQYRGMNLQMQHHCIYTNQFLHRRTELCLNYSNWKP